MNKQLTKNCYQITTLPACKDHVFSVSLWECSVSLPNSNWDQSHRMLRWDSHLRKPKPCRMDLQPLSDPMLGKLLGLICTVRNSHRLCSIECPVPGLWVKATSGGDQWLGWNFLDKPEFLPLFGPLASLVLQISSHNRSLSQTYNTQYQTRIFIFQE